MTYWPKYLWVGFPNLISVSPLHFMYAVGVIEIVAGVLVLLLPRLAPYVVAAWLGGIVTNLIIKNIAVGGHTNVYWDIALRDFGLMLAAIALARLAAVYAPRRFFRQHG
jgi:ABC-type spermidine/putrescine transport system permease subunit I